MAIPTTVDAAMVAARVEYDATMMENVSTQLRLEQAQRQLKRSKADFASFHASDRARIASLGVMTPSWDDIATLEHQTNHELLDILGPINTIKFPSCIATTPTVLGNDFLDIEPRDLNIQQHNDC